MCVGGGGLYCPEELGLLSKGEAIIYDRSAPGSIAALGFVLAFAGAAAVALIPDDSTALIAGQAIVGAATAVGFGVALTASSTLSKLQN